MPTPLKLSDSDITIPQNAQSVNNNYMQGSGNHSQDTATAQTESVNNGLQTVVDSDIINNNNDINGVEDNDKNVSRRIDGENWESGTQTLDTGAESQAESERRGTKETLKGRTAQTTEGSRRRYVSENNLRSENDGSTDTELLERGAISTADRSGDSIRQQGRNSAKLAEYLGGMETVKGKISPQYKAGKSGWILQKNGSQSGKTGYDVSILRRVSGVTPSGKDTVGRVLNNEIVEKFKNTIFKNDNGDLLSLYHWTTAVFDIFAKGEFGFHFGTLKAAHDIYEEIKKQKPNTPIGIYKEIYLNITNPIELKDDGQWTAGWVALQLVEKGIISEHQYELLGMTTGFYDNTYDNPAAKAVRDILKEKGYDGIIYKNESEDAGSYSVIALYPDQILTVAENGVLKEGTGVTESNVASSDTDYELSDNDQYAKDKSFWTAENKNDTTTNETNGGVVSFDGVDTDKIINLQKISIGMSEKERYEILKDKKILLADVNTEDYEKVINNYPDLLNKRLKKSQATKLLKKVGEEFEVYGNYKNEDIELDFEFGKNNLDESVTKQKSNYDSFTKMLSCFSDVINNAVGIEAHNRNNEGYKEDVTLKQMYVLCSAFLDGDTIIPVKMEIKEFIDKPNRLYVAVALEGIKKDRVVSMGVPNNRSHVRTSPVTISISEILKNVNLNDKDFVKYIPKQFFENSDTDYELSDSDQYAKDKSFWTAENKNDTTTNETNGGVVSFDGVDTDRARHLNKAEQEKIRNVADRLGRKVIYEDFYSLDKFKGKKRIPDGYIDGNGDIHINFYAKRPIQFIFKHEITHYLKNSLPSYQDFMDKVLKSKAFEKWLHSTGYASIDELKAEIMNTYSEVKGFNEIKCYDEILADFCAGYLFGGKNAVSQKLIDAMEPTHKRTFLEVIKDIIAYFKSKFSEYEAIKAEITAIENKFIEVYKKAVAEKNKSTDTQSGEQYSIANDTIYDNYCKKIEEIAVSDDISNKGKYIEVSQQTPEILIKKANANNLPMAMQFDIAYLETRHDGKIKGNYHNLGAERMKNLPELLENPEFIVKLPNGRLNVIVNMSTDKGNRSLVSIELEQAKQVNGKFNKYNLIITAFGAKTGYLDKIINNSNNQVLYKKTTESQGTDQLHKRLDGINDSVSNNRISQKNSTVKNNISTENENYSIPAETAEDLLDRYDDEDIYYSYPNEFATNVMQWAYSTATKVGDIKIFNTNGQGFVLLKATEEGCIKLAQGNYKEVKAVYERAYNRTNNEFYGNSKSIRSKQGRDIWDLQSDEERRNDNRNTRQTRSEGFQGYTAGSNEHLRTGNRRKSDVDYSIPNQSITEMLDRYDKGEITREELIEGISRKKTLNPVEIANSTEEDANTTPPLKRNQGEADGRNIKTLLEYANENDGFLYQSDKIKEVKQLLEQNGLQLPTPLKLSGFGITIPQNAQSVNNNYMQGSGKNSQGAAIDHTENINSSLQMSDDSGIISDSENNLRSEDDELSDQRTIIGSSQERQAVDGGGTEESRRITAENTVAFGRRIEKVFNGAGRVIKSGNTSLAFLEGKVNSETEAGKACNILKNSGINIVYCQGSIYRNNGSITTESTQAVTAPDGTVYVSSNATLQGVEIALHEAVHVAQKTKPEIFGSYALVLWKKINLTSEAYRKVANDINDNHYGGKYNIDDIVSRKPVMRELSAYINQFVMTDPQYAEQLFGGMFSDWDAVVEAVHKFNGDIGLDITSDTSNLQSNANDAADSGENGGVVLFGEPDRKEIYREPTADENTEAMLGRGKNAVQRHINDIARKLDSSLRIVWADKNSDNLNGKNGKYVREINTIYLAKDMSVAEMYFEVFKHEFVHRLESKAAYKSFKDYLFNRSRAFEEYVRSQLKIINGEEFGGSREDAINNLTEYYYNRFVNDKSIGKPIRDRFTLELAQREIVADFAGDILFKDNKNRKDIAQALADEDISAIVNTETSTTALEELAKTDRNLFQKLWDIIKDFIASLKTVAQNKSLSADLEYIEQRLARVYDSRDTKKAAKQSGGEQYELKSYSKHQIENWKNSKRIVVYQNEIQFRQFIENSKNDKSYVKKLYFGAIPTEYANFIKQKTGIDVENYNCTLESEKIRKIFKDHGDTQKEKLRGQKAVTINDILNIPKVLLKPNEIAPSEDLYEGKPAINFIKSNGNEKTTVTAVVSDKHLDLFVQTMYINQKGSIATPTDVQASVNTPKATRGTASTDNRIAQNNSDVNNNISEKSEKYSEDGQFSVGSPLQEAREKLNKDENDKLWNEAIEKYGSIPEGENATDEEKRGCEKIQYTFLFAKSMISYNGYNRS